MMDPDVSSERSPREPLLFAFWFACIGILADRICIIIPSLWIISMVSFLTVWWFVWGNGKPFSWLPLAAAIACAFGAWHHVYWHVYPANQIAAYAAADRRPVCLRVRVCTSPQNFTRAADPLAATIDPEQSTFAAEAMAMRLADGTWERVSGRCTARVRGHVEKIAAGDEVVIFGHLSLTSPPLNPGVWDPSWVARMRRLLCRLDIAHPSCITLSSSASAWNPRWFVPRLRFALQTSLLRHIDEPAGGLAVAVLLGNREHVPPSTFDSFLVTGTIHLLAISGLHVGILAYSLLYGLTLLRVPRPAALWGVMVFCLLYALLTGVRAPVLRATVIVWVACLGTLWYRPNFSFNSLAAAGVIVLSINPAQLFAPGAQLSFVAVAAIIWIVPTISDATAGRLSRLVYRRRRSLVRMALARGLRNVLTVALASMVIWIVALPLVMYHFHLVSPIALLLNTFAWIPLWAALLSGFATMLLGWLPSSVVAVPATVCQWSLGGLTNLVGRFDHVPGGHFWVSGPPFWPVVTFYCVVAIGIAFPVIRPQWKRYLGGAAVLFCISWGMTQQMHVHQHQPLGLTFLSVGHGTCVILEFPDGNQRQFWIYDAGQMGSSRHAVEQISHFLWSRGTTRIEGLLLSHADVDHFNAIPGLAQRFSIGTIYTTTPFLENHQPAARLLVEALNQHHIPIRCVSAGDTIEAGCDVKLRVLHPHKRFAGGTDNEQSIVACLEYQGQRILLPGDLEGEGMERLLASARLDCDLVLAPHHGSHHSDPDRFCDWATPEWVVISGGHHQAVKKGKALFQQRGATVLQTTDDGAIEAQIDGGVLRVTSHRPDGER
jgi:competence protein ComEC